MNEARISSWFLQVNICSATPDVAAPGLWNRPPVRQVLFKVKVAYLKDSLLPGLPGSAHLEGLLAFYSTLVNLGCFNCAF